jgi:site-specific DNA-adenine methylase
MAFQKHFVRDDFAINSCIDRHYNIERTLDKEKLVQGDRLWQAAGRLQGTTVTTGDYLPLLQTPGHDVWIYCDPCYYVNNELARGKWLYRHIFTEQQHVEFARHVRACSHKVLISYDDHSFIRSLYSGLNIYSSDPIRYQLNGKKTRELFIANY